eukprot:Em0005g40a
MIKYQAIMCQLFSSYPVGVCIKYDSLFRQAVARDKARLIPWDQVKEDILAPPPPPDQTLPVAPPPPSLADMSLTPSRVRRSAGALTTALAPESAVHLPTSAGSQVVGATTPAKPVPGPWGSLADQQVHTPLRPSEFERELRNHPDKAWVTWLLNSILYGVSIGFNGPHTPYTARNLPSALQHPEVVSSELQKEVEAGRVLGPFAERPLPNLRTSGLGAAPKKNGKWRVILHLSAPHGTSVNDGILKEEFSLHYSSVDDAVGLLHTYGTGAIMAKIDLKSTFRMVPVRPADWDLLGMFWDGMYYVDTCLPFGLRSAPCLFNRFADALHWVLATNYHIDAVHYLDDFLLVGAAGQQQCTSSVQVTLSVCERLGIPVAFEKLEGPSTQITFLGIVLDSEARRLSLPQDKLRDILQMVQSWLGRYKSTKRELLSLIGKLSFAAKVVPAGRLFLRRLIDLSTTVDRLHHHLRINSEARADLAWWARFLPTWNGVAMFLDPGWISAETLNLFTDASGIHGFGGYFNGSWFRGSWLPHQELSQRSIQWQELFAIVAAAHAWGHKLAGHRIRFHCDNQAVVHAWSGRTGPHLHTHSISQSLDTDLVSLIHRALAGSTTSTYKVGIQRYLTFCRALDLVPVPSTKRQVALFATHLSTSLRLPTIRVYLAAVSFLHHIGGHRSPVSGNTILKLVLRGIQRKQTQSQCRTPRLPITPQILADLLKHLGCDSTIPSQDRLMLKAAMSLAFFGFLRVSELTVPAYHTSCQFLARRDIQFLGHQLKVFLTHSKTDQFGQGSVITVGCSEDAFCPVSAMQHYLESCRTPPSRPLFHFRNGMPLTAKKFRAILRFNLKSLGFNPSLFNTHSFRIGAATAAAKAGMSSSTIMELGRWRSAAFHSYVRHHPAHPSAAAQMAKAL